MNLFINSQASFFADSDCLNLRNQWMQKIQYTVQFAAEMAYWILPDFEMHKAFTVINLCDFL